MKKFLSIVGGLFLLLVVAGICGFGYLAFQGRGLDTSSKAYIEKNVPEMTANWSKAEVLKRASPQLLKVIDEKPEQFDQLLQKLSKLGAMKRFTDLKGESNVSYTTQNGKVITAAYFGHARFEHGEGEITIRLIRASEQWQLMMFDVKSPLFLQ